MFRCCRGECWIVWCAVVVIMVVRSSEEGVCWEGPIICGINADLSKEEVNVDEDYSSGNLSCSRHAIKRFRIVLLEILWEKVDIGWESACLGGTDGGSWSAVGVRRAFQSTGLVEHRTQNAKKLPSTRAAGCTGRRYGRATKSDGRHIKFKNTSG